MVPPDVAVTCIWVLFWWLHAFVITRFTNLWNHWHSLLYHLLTASQCISLLFLSATDSLEKWHSCLYVWSLFCQIEFMFTCVIVPLVIHWRLILLDCCVVATDDGMVLLFIYELHDVIRHDYKSCIIPLWILGTKPPQPNFRDCREKLHFVDSHCWALTNPNYCPELGLQCSSVDCCLCTVTCCRASFPPGLMICTAICLLIESCNRVTFYAECTLNIYSLILHDVPVFSVQHGDPRGESVNHAHILCRAHCGKMQSPGSLRTFRQNCYLWLCITLWKVAEDYDLALREQSILHCNARLSFGAFCASAGLTKLRRLRAVCFTAGTGNGRDHCQ